MAKSFLYSGSILVSASIWLPTHAIAQIAPSPTAETATPSADAASTSERAQAPEPTESSATSQTVDAGDIVVTASRRSQNLQDVPMSITALSAQTLENKVATKFFDYAASIPNLSFAVGGIGASSGRSIAVRGIADVNTTGFYIDDSPLPESLDPRILDIERIEVLRGPQGTLYGARSLGGTVRLISIQPSASETSGRVHGILSSTRNTDRANYQLDGALNLPVVEDRIGLRLVGLHQKDAGYFTRTFDRPEGGTKTVRNVAQANTNGFSASAIVELTDDLSITPRFLYQKTRLNGYPLADVAVNKTSPVPNILRVGSLDQRRMFDLPESSKDEWYLGTLDVKLDRSFGTISSASTLFQRRTRDVEDMSDFVAAAFGLSSQIPTTIDVRHPIDSFAQELRFSSSFEGPVQIVAGLFYNNLRTNQISPPIVLAGLDTAAGGAFGTDFLYEKEWPTEQKDYAAYGEVSWKITTALTAILGARAFKNETTSSITGKGIVYGGLASRPETKLTEKGITPKASLQYEFSRGNQIYATAAKGFRPGGPNQLFPAALGCPAELEADFGLSENEASFYKSDSVWSYEVGAKATTFDGKLRASAAAFRIDWSDIQQRVELRCGFGFINNSGSARSEGFELELTAIPFDGLTIGAGAGYVDAKFLESSGGSRFKAGDLIPQVPKWTVNLNANYRRALSSRVDGVVSADYAYVGSSNSSINANVDASGRLIPRIRPSYEMVNARLGISIDGVYELAAFAKNLTDERASLSDITNAASEAPGRARVSITAPRTIGLELRAKF